MKKDESTNYDFFDGSVFHTIYAYTNPDSKRLAGCIKVGDTSIPGGRSVSSISDQEVEAANIARIKEQTNTAMTAWKLEFSMLAVKPIKKVDASGNSVIVGYDTFRDFDVRDVLYRNGFERFSDEMGTGREWVVGASKDDVAKAFQAVVNGEDMITSDESYESFVPYPNQKLAINRTLSVLTGSLDSPKRMLWNAKMRFGKTCTAYSLAEEAGFKKVLILTHRPVLSTSWQRDFYNLVHMQSRGWKYGSKQSSNSFDSICDGKFVWFASIQDLRMSGTDSDTLVKNERIFDTEWDLVITDEAHEGSLTKLADSMFRTLKSKNFLDLSGTPFNITEAEEIDSTFADRYEYDGVFNWSYLDEQKAKNSWDTLHPGEKNPYAQMPSVELRTYSIEDLVNIDGCPVDSMSDIFATEVDGNGEIVFVHALAVQDFLDKNRGNFHRSTVNPESFPFHPSNIDNFKHTLWVMPNVAACRAMENLLSSPVSGFAGWEIINATGVGNCEHSGESRDALARVEKAVNSKNMSITLTCRMLTTGTSIPQWQAVFMLSDTESAISYLQSAFRCTTPYTSPEGWVKQKAYIFDYKFDRAIGIIVNAACNAHSDSKSSNNQSSDETESSTFIRDAVDQYLKYMPIVSLKSGHFEVSNTDSIMRNITETFAREVVSKGFNSPRLFNEDELNKNLISKKDVLNELRSIQGALDKSVNIFDTDDEQTIREREAQIEYLKNKASEDLTDEEERQLEKHVKDRDANKKAEIANRKNAITILAGVASRIPAMIFAMRGDDEIRPNNFNLKIDDESWKEFMPKNLLRVKPDTVPSFDCRADVALSEMGHILYWEDIARFFNEEVFVLACNLIREKVTSTRKLANKSGNFLEYSLRMASIVETFKNPDKETVFTPWSVVTKQYCDTVGGLSFIDFDKTVGHDTYVWVTEVETGNKISVQLNHAISGLDEGMYEIAPRWFNGKHGSDLWFKDDVTIYDFNSKTALYPLCAATSKFFVNLMKESGLEFPSDGDFVDLECLSLTGDKERIWNNVVSNNVALNVRVGYSALIAKSVLMGYDETAAVNVSTLDIIKTIANFKQWNNLGKKDRVAGWKRRENIYDDISVLLRLINPVFHNDLDIEKYIKLVESNNMADKTEVFRVLDSLDPKTLRQFDFTISNPPYTVLTNAITRVSTDKNKASAITIYPEFFITSFYVSRMSSIISPARWFNSSKPECRTIRDLIKDNGLDSKFPLLYKISDSWRIFPEVQIKGGISYWLFDNDYNGDTEFVVDGVTNPPHALLSSFNLVTADSALGDIVDAIRSKIQDSNKIISWRNTIGNDFVRAGLKASTLSMINETTEVKHDGDIAVFIPKFGWRYLRKGILSEGSVVPEGKCAIAFSGASDRNKGSINDRTLFVKSGETAKSTIAFIFNSPTEAFRFYQFAKTKLFTLLVEARLSSHNTNFQAYKFIPKFDFSSTDVIDWDASVVEIDSQLEKFFGLQKYHDYIQSYTMPFARPFEPEMIERFRECGIEVTE